MRIASLSCFLMVVVSLPAVAEVVQISDGRSVDLKADGTYEFVEATKLSDGNYVEFEDAYFELKNGQFGQKFVRFIPIFKNISKKTIIGVKFTTSFLNSFGDEVFSFSGDSDEPVLPGKTSKHDLFYSFEDNQFINSEPYDKLLPMVTNKTGKIKTTLTMIAFKGGEIVKLTE